VAEVAVEPSRRPDGGDPIDVGWLGRAEGERALTIVTADR
jgi:hypothetical protein